MDAFQHATYRSFVRYYNPTEENRKTIELLKVGNHDDAMDMVCSDPDANHDDINECESSILFGFCALLAGNVELADMYLANALVIWEQMPAVTPCQPLPYEKKAIEKMVKLLKEEDKDRSARRDAAIALIPEHLRPSRPATSGVSDVPDRSVMPEAGR